MENFFCGVNGNKLNYIAMSETGSLQSPAPLPPAADPLLQKANLPLGKTCSAWLKSSGLSLNFSGESLNFRSQPLKFSRGCLNFSRQPVNFRVDV